MLVTDKRTWLQMVFALRGSSLERTWARILVVTLFAIAVTVVEFSLDVEKYSLTPMPFTLMGLTMAIFLGFRNSAAYDRYWEGRRLWGTLVNASRSFARQVAALVVPTSESDDEQTVAAQQELVRTMLAYVHAFRHHLRGTSGEQDIRVYLTDDAWLKISDQANRPIAILHHLGQLVRQQWQLGRISQYHVPVLEGSLQEVTNVQGGCERIKSTPIPFTYSVLIHRIVAGYCFAMPFGLMETLGVLTPVGVCLISYGFFGLDSIGDDIEQPFEQDPNDLPLDAISRNIEINLLESIGAGDVPPALKPVDGVLM